MNFFFKTKYRNYFWNIDENIHNFALQKINVK